MFNEESTSKVYKRGCLFYIKWGTALVILLIVTLCIVGFTYEMIMQRGDADRYSPPGQLVDVDGYSMHIYCRGEGSPTIILESGAGGFSMMWSQSMMSKLSQTVRVCAYDRAGYGWSDTRPEARTTWQIAYELHSLLENTDLKPPLVLVGASIGGLYVRRYVAEYPQDVAGVVLLDATFEADLENIKRAPSEIFVVMGRLGIFRLFPEMICPGTTCDAESKSLIAAFRGRQTMYQTMDREWDSLQSANELTILRDQISTAGALGNLPLMILHANQSGLLESEMEVSYREHLDRYRTAMTSLSSNHRYVLVDGGHGIANEYPELVVDSIKAVIDDSVRTDQPIP